jgi:outer membrane protein
MLASTLLVFGACFAASMSARAEDLIDVYKLATQNDSQLRAARATLNAQLELKPQARARVLPTLNLSADYSRTRSESTSGSTTTEDDYPSRGISVTLTQPLYRADAFAQLDQADAQVSAAYADFKAQEQNLALRVAEGYFAVLSALDNLTFARAEHESIGKQLEQTKQRFNVGLIAITDVHEAQSRFDLSSAQLILAENRLANEWDALRELTGTNVKSLVALQPEAPLLPPSPADVEQWVQSSLKQNPALQSSKFSVDAAQYEVKRQRGLGYPTVDARGSYSDTDNSESDNLGAERTSTSIWLELNWGIYRGGSVDSATRRAEAQLEQAKENMEQQRRDISLRTRASYLGVQANISRANALKQAVVSARSALSATEAGYEVGTRTTVDVLNARTQLFLAQRDHAQSRYDYVLAILNLKSSAGSLELNDLQQINGWLKK